MATSTSTDATKTERLLLVKTGKAACHLPAPAATSELVLDAIKTSHALTDDERFALAQAWTSGSTFDENRIKQLDPDVRRNAMVKDRQLYAACESEFQLHDVGRHGNMHDKLSLFTEWDPSVHTVVYVQNWPTLSKDTNNPDADLWDPKNPSNCATWLKEEGMRRAGVKVFDWTPSRHSNDLTGQNPQQNMSDAFLDACDEWVFHRLLTTIALGGSVVIVSSWCRARFIQKCGKFGLALLPLVLQLPFTSVDTVDTGFQFAYSSTSPNLPGAGKVFFKDSLGMIDKSAEPLALHANDAVLNLIHASAPLVFHDIQSYVLVYLRFGRASTSCFLWFCYELNRLGCQERNADACYKTPEELLSAGARDYFYPRLHLYLANNAIELDRIRPLVPAARRDSLVAASFLLMHMRGEATYKKMREIHMEDGSVMSGTGHDVWLISMGEERRFKTPEGEMIAGDGWQQRKARYMTVRAIKAPDGTVLEGTGRDAYLAAMRVQREYVTADGERKTGSGWDQIASARSKLRRIYTSTGSFMGTADDSFRNSWVTPIAYTRKDGTPGFGTARDRMNETLDVPRPSKLEPARQIDGRMQRAESKATPRPVHRLSGAIMMGNAADQAAAQREQERTVYCEDGTSFQGDGTQSFHQHRAESMAKPRTLTRPDKSTFVGDGNAQHSNTKAHKRDRRLPNGMKVSVTGGQQTALTRGYALQDDDIVRSGNYHLDQKRVQSRTRARTNWLLVRAGKVKPLKLEPLKRKDGSLVLNQRGEVVKGTSGDQIALKRGQDPLWFDGNPAGRHIRWYPNAVEPVNARPRRAPKASAAIAQPSTSAAALLVAAYELALPSGLFALPPPTASIESDSPAASHEYEYDPLAAFYAFGPLATVYAFGPRNTSLELNPLADTFAQHALLPHPLAPFPLLPTLQPLESLQPFIFPHVPAVVATPASPELAAAEPLMPERAVISSPILASFPTDLWGLQATACLAQSNAPLPSYYWSMEVPDADGHDSDCETEADADGEVDQ